MEKAILKTLIYANIFDYPMTVFEIHKWLIGRKAGLRQVESMLVRLSQKAKVKSQKEYYFLSERDGLVAKRRRREQQSEKYLRKAQVLSSLLQLIPWVKLVGISGGLAMGNADKGDDIDLFIITSKNRLWISRLVMLGLLSLLGQRRKVGEMGGKIAGKLCINTLLEEDRLEQSSKDIYLAHEVLQMKVLWERDGIYSKYLEDNSWAFKFLPNWVAPDTSSPPRVVARGKLRRGSNSKRELFNWIPASAGMTMERVAKWFQLKIMKKPQGMERIGDGALYFHPHDMRSQVLAEFREKVKV